MIKKLVSGALAAATIGGLAIAGPASAQPRGDGHGGGYSRDWDHNRDRRDGDGAAVIGAGILGLALGASLGGQSSYYAPAPAYYAPRGYYAAPGYYGRSCTSHWRWDRYSGRYVQVRDCY